MESLQQIAVKLAIESGTFWDLGSAVRFTSVTPLWIGLKFSMHILLANHLFEAAGYFAALRAQDT